jgi:hypothetical protein
MDVFGLDDLIFGKSRVSKSPTIIVLGSLLASLSSGACFMKFGVLTFGAYVYSCHILFIYFSFINFM